MAYETKEHVIPTEILELKNGQPYLYVWLSGILLVMENDILKLEERVRELENAED